MTRPTNGFNYSNAIRRVCEDFTLRLPVFSQIQMDKVGISFVRARNRELYGVYASMTPLRFQNGAVRTVRDGVTYEIPPVYDRRKRPLLYVLSIYSPRFIDLPLREKIETLIHELYHIGPDFDGDIRRFGERFYAHGASKKDYDRKVARMAREWLGMDPPPELWDFLRYDFNTLSAKRGRIIGTRVKIPSLRPVMGGES